MNRDYQNYDYLYATVKKSKLEKLQAHYRTLGWESIDAEEDNRYDDIQHLSWRRPHKIPNKDALQLFQVYIESAWNRIGKYEKRPRPVTQAFGITAGLLCTAMLVFGLCAILVMGELWQIAGIICVVLGAVFSLLTAIVTIKLFRKEGIKSKLLIEVAEEEIKKACAAAEKLREGGDG